MITRLSLGSFKALPSAALDLGTLTVVAGPNASGKSSVLEALHIASQLGNTAPADLFTGPRNPRILRTREASAPLSLSVDCRFEQVMGSYRIELTPNDDEWFDEAHGRRELDWACSTEVVVGDAREATRASNTNISKSQNPRIAAFGRNLGSSIYLRLEPAQLAAPAASDRAVPRMEFDGSGLAAVLADLKLRDSSRFESLEAMLSSIVPSVKRINFERAITRRYSPPEEPPVWGHELSFDMQAARSVPAHAMSDGTLLALGVLTVLLSRHHTPRLILLDEMERGLHPRAMEEYLAVLRRLLSEQPDVQIVGTTHSPYLIDHFDPSEVVLTQLAENGAAVVSRLTDQADYEKWSKLMSPGEYWTTLSTTTNVGQSDA